MFKHFYNKIFTVSPPPTFDPNARLLPRVAVLYIGTQDKSSCIADLADSINTPYATFGNNPNLKNPDIQQTIYKCKTVCNLLVFVSQQFYNCIDLNSRDIFDFVIVTNEPHIQDRRRVYDDFLVSRIGSFENFDSNWTAATTGSGYLVIDIKGRRYYTFRV